ncbi:putative phloem protein [Helianthus annuus]|nr:putative phloem protein [Helianthus annuus]
MKTLVFTFYICRFQRVVKIVDTSNLKIHIKIKTQFLTPNVNYGAHLVFKFCEPRKLSSKLMYVNLKYQMGSETLHAYFATCRDEEWMMMIELCRFIPHKRSVNFEVLLESSSRYYCGSGAIYVEGIHFHAIDDATLKVLFHIIPFRKIHSDLIDTRIYTYNYLCV